MSREIKFRAWSYGLKSSNPVITRRYGEWVSPPQMLFDEKPGDCLVWKSQGQNIEVMQYTGLKDKNGKEIYEGDIILLGKAVRHIEYDRGSFTLFAGDRRLSPISDYNSEGNYEVIGNVYENPELLEEASVQND